MSKPTLPLPGAPHFPTPVSDQHLLETVRTLICQMASEANISYSQAKRNYYDALLREIALTEIKENKAGKRKTPGLPQQLAPTG